MYFLNLSVYYASNETLQAYILPNSLENIIVFLFDDVIDTFWAVQGEPLGVGEGSPSEIE